MMVLAPTRFSTITCWFQTLVSDWARPRPSTSASPPAGKGTMMRTGLVGKPCAAASDTPHTRPSSVDRQAILLCNTAHLLRGSRNLAPGACPVGLAQLLLVDLVGARDARQRLAEFDAAR